MISIIVACAENRVIGNKNTLPWHLPADFKYFKETTLGKTIVMGLNTFKSIGAKPLPGRKNVVLNNDPNYVPPEGCFLAKSIEEVVEMGKKEPEVMICGGASVYKQFLPLAQRLYLTYVKASPEGDTYFPEVNTEEWKETKREDHKADDKNKYDYSFVILERK
ncbi:MAG: dihydrofolate reductase [Candidatus Staskawiczbacteria bacterium RIFOXYD1_FULL_39_28]|uniref:Dihydrofolate reductase n=1 Tax=Candidatus Staskawiczbacteria bacterium RIFOXYC1_FULL_38_18 TaxID=1802229 RepID=A0A1G2J918_9BACT|nr:MAG: dihydrofolate reductase [Candidatus Staskawiczbacteria bacterium RIFOXYC1_FULL_38_18]OGZ92165.1 MAG: dihydrofolate reductase [Candidatus Staskawiczbacteria bacterium RIFOXYD1_FULL_39_28]